MNDDIKFDCVIKHHYENEKMKEKIVNEGRGADVHWLFLYVRR